MSPICTHVYSVYGRSFACDQPFTSSLQQSAEPADFQLEFSAQPPWDRDRWHAAHRISPDDCAHEVEIRRDGEQWAIEAPGESQFASDGRRFTGWIANQDRQVLGEIQFLDVVLPFALELADVPFIHASAVEWQGRAIAFSAFAGGGKSSLTTALTKRGGRFLTDDVLVLERRGGGFLAYPGYPQIRLWADAAEALLPSNAHEQIHPVWPKRRGIVDRFGEFARSPFSLAALFLLDTESDVDSPRITSIAGHAGLLKLLGNLPALAALDCPTQARRTKFFGELLNSTRVCLLQYPRRYDVLDEVLDAVLAEVGGP